MNSNQIYEMVTNKIIEELEKGNFIWRKGWNTYRPQNCHSKREYHGINILWLSLVQQNRGYKYPYWLTFLETKKSNGMIKKGEKATDVFYYNFKEIEEEKEIIKDGETGKKTVKKTIPIIRSFKVFNVEQTTIEVKEPEELRFNPIGNAEQVLNYNGKPKYRESGNRAYYNINGDEITLPPREQFKTNDDYYSVLFHENIHATGHKSRLDRDTVTQTDGFGNNNYSKEELIAEIGNAFLCSETGIKNQDIFKNSLAYIQGWLQALKNDKRLIFSASNKAEKAVQYIKENQIKEENKILVEVRC